MKSTRIALVIAAAAGTGALVTGCAAGPGAATLAIQPNYAAGASGDVAAQGVVVVVDPATGAAQVTGTVVNNGDTSDRLTGVTLNGKNAFGYSVDLDGHSTYNLASGKGEKFATANSGAVAGKVSQVALTFASGATIALSAETQPNTGIYSQYSPSN